MDAKTFISRLSDSGDVLLKSASDSLGRWSGMKHNKECLETFLNHNIALLEFVSAKNEKVLAVCCSNTTFVGLFNMNLDSMDVKAREKLPKVMSNGMRSRSTTSVTTWNLLKHNYFTIPLKSWKIVSFVEIDGENMLLLDKIVKDILQKRRSERTNKP